jgi:hypothetical protein
MKYVVRAVPLLQPVEEIQAVFATQLGERRAETDAFYGGNGVVHESVHLQEMPTGPMLIIVTVIEDQSEVRERFRVATDEYASWLKSQVLKHTGVDANVTPAGPQTTELFCWEPA